ncbi:MAG: hypothetical protein ACKPKO_47115, partial [Candidatus Fonsibacter sp.]
SKDKSNNSSKGKSKGKRGSSRAPSSTPLPKGPCYAFIKTGECTKPKCPYDHYSSTQMEQIKKALGHGNCGGREQSRDSIGSKWSRNGRSKGKGKGKREGNGKSVGAKTEDAPSQDGKKWCLAHMKGTCKKGDSCPNLHYDEGGKSPNRGRSPSRDNQNKSEWRPKTEKTTKKKHLETSR